MRIYMDVCVFNRPLDLQEQPRIRLETEAILSILEDCEKGSIALVVSDVVLAEIFATRNTPRRDSILEFTRVARELCSADDSVRKIAADFQQKAGLASTDSLHLAMAQGARVDVFLTTDDRLLRKARGLKTDFTTMNPVDFLRESYESSDRS